MKKLCAMVIASFSFFMTSAAEYESTTYTSPTTKYEKTYKTKYESKYNGNGSRRTRRPVRMKKEQTTTEERYAGRPRKKFKETYQEEQQYQQPQQYRSESRYQSESSY